MTNHIHLIAVPDRKTSLAKARGRTHSDYAPLAAHPSRRVRAPLAEPVLPCPLQSSHTWAALAYVERNPVRAGLVAKPEDWRWSRAGKHLGHCHWPDWLALQSWSDNWTPEQWRNIVEHGLSEAALRDRLHEATRTGRPLGNAKFVNDCEQRSGMSLRKQKPGPKRKQVSSNGAPAELYDVA